MVQDRLAREEERESYLAFADHVFGFDARGSSFAEFLPKVYGKGIQSAHLQHVAVDDERGMVGLVASLPGMLHTPWGNLKTGFVGTVSVREDARGEGHMKRLMRMTLDDMRAQGCDLTMLSGRRQRYEYFGYVPAGEQYDFYVSRACVKHALARVDASRVRFEGLQAGTELASLAQRLHEERGIYYERSEPDFVTVCRSYACRPFAVLENGHFAGFMIVNRDGTKIDDLCIADNGMMDRVIKAWFGCLEQEKDEVEIRMPAWETERRLRLSEYAEDMHCTCAVKARIFNYAKVVKTLLEVKASYARLTDGKLELDCEGQQMTLQVCAQRVTVTPGAARPLRLSCLEAGRLLLTPFAAQEEQLRVNWFPLPLGIGEADEF